MSAYLFLVIALVLNAVANLLIKYAARASAPVHPNNLICTASHGTGEARA